MSSLNPDYIFVSNPYDRYRPKEYNSNKLSSIAKLCHIEYGAIIINDNNSFISFNQFYKNCSYNFISSHYELSSSKKLNNNIFKKKFVPVGCLKLDKFLYYQSSKKDKWKKFFNDNDVESLRAVWKPRWTIEKPKPFFDFLKSFVAYSKFNNIKVLLLEHLC